MLRRHLFGLLGTFGFLRDKISNYSQFIWVGNSLIDVEFPDMVIVKNQDVVLAKNTKTRLRYNGREYLTTHTPEVILPEELFYET